jgi:hypothetical protein
MTMRLKAERCLSVIDGRHVPPPAVTPLVPNATPGQTRAYETNLAEYTKKLDDFESAEGSAASAINSTLSPEVESLLKDTTNPRDMWNILREKLNTATSRTLQCSVTHAFNSAKHDGKETVQVYFRRLRDFQRQLAGSEEEISDTQIISKVLNTLPEVYRPKIAAIEDRGDLTIDLLEKALVGWQSSMNISRGSSSSTALTTRVGGRKAFGKGRGKPFKKSDSVSKGSREREVECWYCTRKGHTQNECRTKKEAEKRRAERNKSSSKTDTASSSSAGASAKAAISDADRFTDVTDEPVALMTNSNLFINVSPGTWYIDSGATDHMCYDRAQFTYLKRFAEPRGVTLGDDSRIEAFGSGDIPLSTNRTLKNVLYVPDLGMNLLSVSTVTRLGFEVTFELDHCRLSKKRPNDHYRDETW